MDPHSNKWCRLNQHVCTATTRWTPTGVPLAATLSPHLSCHAMIFLL
jgi:hypothetical protein